MADEQAEPTDDRGLIWRIADFPLVAMLIAIVVYHSATGGAVLLVEIARLDDSHLSSLIKGMIVLACYVIAYKLAIRPLGRRPRDDLAASPRAFAKFGAGLLFGTILFAAIVGVAAMLHVYRIVAHGDTSDLVPAIFVTGLIPGLSEEILARGILFRWIEEFAGSWVSLVLTSALFGLAHIMNPNATAFSSFAIAVEAGLLFGGAYMLTRSLWLPVGLHAGWNFTQGEIFDVPVSGFDSHGLVTAKLSGPALLSGGNFGLEASIIALIIATAAGGWIVWLAVRNGEVVRPWRVAR